MELPPAVQKGWPFALAAVIFIFIAFQLSQAAGCARSERREGGPAWPMQRTAPPPPRE